MANNIVPFGAPGRRAGAKKPAGTLKPGQVVFFNGCKKTTKQNSEPFIFKGHGFGVFLGVVPQHVREPGKEQMDGLLAGIGWVSFENVIELLGEDQFNILEEKFRKKYDMEAIPEDEAMPENPPAPLQEREIAMPSKELLGADGKPMVRNEEPPEVTS